MKKTVTLNLKSEIVEEQIEIPEKLWERFEQRAKELGVPPEELAVIALDNFLKARGH
jgi:hypothetical protein